MDGFDYLDDFDYCYECGGYGDDYLVENGELKSENERLKKQLERRT